MSSKNFWICALIWLVCLVVGFIALSKVVAALLPFAVIAVVLYFILKRK